MKNIAHPNAALLAPTMTSLSRGSGRSLGTKLGGIGALLALVSACSPAPMPISRSSHDPSSPSAPEGVTPTVASAAVPAAPAQPAHEHHHHGVEHGAPATAGHEGHGGSPAAADGGTQGVVYECPMHPEVTSTGPGICPKCNMKLVPKK